MNFWLPEVTQKMCIGKPQNGTRYLHHQENPQCIKDLQTKTNQRAEKVSWGLRT